MSNQEKSYRIVFCESSNISRGVEGIVKNVNQLCCNGWKVQGGISTIRTGPDSYKFFQAMIKD